jgi:abequosyltransferase
MKQIRVLPKQEEIIRMIKLSICIPTYNRADYLTECLNSILESLRGYEDKIEIIVSDNASTDNTETIVAEFQKLHSFIRYNRNEKNVIDKNYFIAARLAKGEFIWIFGDDDKIASETIEKIFNLIKSNYNLIICNHSIWTADFSSLLRERWLFFYKNRTFNNHNELLKYLGLKLGFISSVIFNKKIFCNFLETEFDKYIETGWAFLYSIYSGIVNNCNAYLIAKPLVYARGANPAKALDTHWWYKTFAIESDVVFNELKQKGYSDYAIYSAKQNVLKDYIMHDISYRKRNNLSLKGIFRLIMPHYKRHWFFWMVCMPVMFSPKVCVWIANKVVFIVRKFGNYLIGSNNKIIGKTRE